MSKAGSIKKTVVYVLLCLVIISTAVVFTILLVKLKKPPERAEQKWLAPLVKVEQLHTRDIQMVVSGFGTVRAKVEVEIAPQIFGNVVWINQQFRKGGFIPAGEVLLEIDPRDYELAVQQAQAAVAEAQVLLDLEKAEAKVVFRMNGNSYTRELSLIHLWFFANLKSGRHRPGSNLRRQHFGPQS
jgi:multidrug efflux pump subunit AcrA (membrane-fusion protein)